MHKNSYILQLLSQVQTYMVGKIILDIILSGVARYFGANTS